MAVLPILPALQGNLQDQWRDGHVDISVWFPQPSHERKQRYIHYTNISILTLYILCIYIHVRSPAKLLSKTLKQQLIDRYHIWLGIFHVMWLMNSFKHLPCWQFGLPPLQLCNQNELWVWLSIYYLLCEHFFLSFQYVKMQSPRWTTKMMMMMSSVTPKCQRRLKVLALTIIYFFLS